MTRHHIGDLFLQLFDDVSRRDPRPCGQFLGREYSAVEGL